MTREASPEQLRSMGALAPRARLAAGIVVLVALGVVLLADPAEASLPRVTSLDREPAAVASLGQMTPAPTVLASGVPERDREVLFSLFDGDELAQALDLDGGDLVEGLAVVDIALASRARDTRFHPLQSLDLLVDEPLRGPPESYPENRIRAFELSAPFRVGVEPKLSLWSHQACGFSCPGLASVGREDPLGLAVSKSKKGIVVSDARNDGVWYLIPWAEAHSNPASTVEILRRGGLKGAALDDFMNESLISLSTSDSRVQALGIMGSQELSQNQRFARRAETQIATAFGVGKAIGYVAGRAAGAVLGRAASQEAGPVAKFLGKEVWKSTPSEVPSLVPPGGWKFPQSGPPRLPPFSGRTDGVLVPIQPAGDPIPLTSGPRTGARFPYSQADGHVETAAASTMEERGITEGIVYHNNPNGTCPNCDRYVPAFLQEGSKLTVVPPPGAVPRSPLWKANPTDYLGNAKGPR